MKMLSRLLPVVLVVVWPSATTAQTLEDLAWIAGTWVTDLEDQVLEERWSPPMANAMTGSFRWARNGEVWLYEFLLIEETADGIFYYLRHFSPGSIGWEEREAPLAYRLDTLAPERAEFTSTDTPGDSFVFTRDGQQLTIEIVSADDTKRFVYTAANEAATESAAAGPAGVESDPPAAAPDSDGAGTEGTDQPANDTDQATDAAE